MELITKLPVELVFRVLLYVPPHGLQDIFQLSTISDDSSAYGNLRHLALCAMFYNKPAAMYAPSSSLMLEINENLLDYLHERNMVVRPKSIDIFLRLPSENFHISKYMNILKRLTDCFHIHILTSHHILPLDDFLISTILQPLKQVHSISIEQTSCIPQQVACACLLAVPITALRLYYYNAQATIGQVHSLTDTIKHLDISFNGLSDASLRQIKFPSLLESLNMSNNNMFHLSDYNFDIKSLPHLKCLNLSNNNLLSISLRGSNNLLHLDVSGNNLTNLQWLQTPAFLSVQSVNLAYNMIAKLDRFPPKLRFVNLSGNFCFHLSVH